MKQPILVVKAEEKRAERARAARVTKTADHAINCADLLDLHHRTARAGRVRTLKALHDDPIEIAAYFLEPLLRLAQVIRRGREANLLFVRQKFMREFFEARPAFAERQFEERLAVSPGKQVEDDEERRMGDGEFLHAAGRGMETQLQLVER